MGISWQVELCNPAMHALYCGMADDAKAEIPQAQGRTWEEETYPRWPWAGF